jgi:hypothetical protein
VKGLEGTHLVFADSLRALEVVRSDLDILQIAPGAAEDLEGGDLFLDLARIDRREEGIDLALVKDVGHGGFKAPKPGERQDQTRRRERGTLRPVAPVLSDGRGGGLEAHGLFPLEDPGIGAAVYILSGATAGGRGDPAGRGGDLDKPP